MTKFDPLRQNRTTTVVFRKSDNLGTSTVRMILVEYATNQLRNDENVHGHHHKFQAPSSHITYQD